MDIRWGAASQIRYIGMWGGVNGSKPGLGKKKARQVEAGKQSNHTVQSAISVHVDISRTAAGLRRRAFYPLRSSAVTHGGHQNYSSATAAGAAS